MIVVDTSSLQRFLANIDEDDTRRVAVAIAMRDAYLAPVVLTEALTHAALNEQSTNLILSLPLLHPLDGYWFRAGLTRRAFGGALGDVLIAQSCLDYDLPLVTYDSGFRRFVPAGLKLVIEEV